MDNQQGKAPRIKISREAYEKIKQLATLDEYRGRGAVGVVDKLVLGKFSTKGSGRPKKVSDISKKGL